MELELGIVTLLRATWLAAILPIIVACLPPFRSNPIHGALLGIAKRGKIMPSSSKKFTVPQRFFGHFYVVAVVWTTLLLVTTWVYAYRMVPSVSEPILYSTIASHLTGGGNIFLLNRSRSTKEHTNTVWRSVFLLLLMEAQVLRRFFETIYVFKYSPSARMHIFGYLSGLVYWIPVRTLICLHTFLTELAAIGFSLLDISNSPRTAAPLSLCCTFAPEVFNFVEQLVLEFIVKGKTRMSVPEFEFWAFVTPITRLRWFVWVGAAIFLWGWMHQRRCHEILGSLRDNTEQVEEYVIPYGDWFEYVSSPHYLAEIVIYGGLVIASGGADLTIWLLFGFVVTNLVFVAAETHRWYLQKFDNYPKSRFAIIPFLY